MIFNLIVIMLWYTLPDVVDDDDDDDNDDIIVGFRFQWTLI